VIGMYMVVKEGKNGLYVDGVEENNDEE